MLPLRLAMTGLTDMKRRMGRAMMLLGFVIVLLMIPAGPGFCKRIAGSLVIGEQKYLIDGSINHNGDHTVVEFTVRSGKNIAGQIRIFISTDNGYFEFNGRKYPLSNTLSRSWKQQLDSEFKNVLESYSFTKIQKNSTVIYDSVGLVEIQSFLPGKLRLTYQPKTGIIGEENTGGKRVGELISVRFFSLGEWNNRFHDYVALGLDFL